MRWTALTNVSIDPTTGNQIGTAVAKSKEIKGFVHFVSPSSSGMRIYSEIEIGNAIVDLLPGEDIDGRQDTVFEFADQQWVQKEVGKGLALAWAALFGDQRLHRTVLLKLKT